MKFILAQGFGGFLPWSRGPIAFETAARCNMTETNHIMKT